MNGYYPVTDRTIDYYFQIAFPGLPILGPAESAVMRLEVKPTIDAIMQGTALPADAPWPAEKRNNLVAQYVERFKAFFNSSLADGDL